MSALVKEMLFSLHKLDVESRMDLLETIRKLYKDSILGRLDIIILDKFLQGYSCEEILEIIQSPAIKTRDEIEMCILRTLRAIEFNSKYLDSDFVHKVRSLGTYSVFKINQLVLFLQMYSNTTELLENFVVNRENQQ